MRLRPLHRARRFLGSLRPGPLAPGDLDWVRGVLGERQSVLFARMSTADQRHSVAVARRAAAALDAMQPAPTRADVARATAAALLHDVGKSVAALGTYGRVVATLSGWVAGHDMAAAWQQGSGLTRRVGLYLDYPRLGGELLEINGADEWVVAWAIEHHLDPQHWSLPVEIATVLSEADR